MHIKKGPETSGQGFVYLHVLVKSSMNRILNIAVALVILASGILAVESCRDPKETKAEILVVDSIGDVVENATVYIYCIDQPNKQPCVVKDTQNTGPAGITTHVFDNPAVLKVEAVKYDVVTIDTGVFPNIGTMTIGDTLCGETFITLEERQTIQEEVVLLICPSDD